MIENIVFLAIIGLAITEVIFIIGLIILNSKIAKLKSFERDYEVIRMIQKDNNSIIKRMCDAVDEERETYEHMYELCDLMTDQNNKIVEQYQNILKQYELFHDAFKTINDNYKKLLNCWKDVTNACDISSEQFRLCSEELKKVVELRDLIQRVLDPWVLDSDQLGEAVLHGFNHDYKNVNGITLTDYNWPEPDTETDIDDHPREEEDEE